MATRSETLELIIRARDEARKSLERLNNTLKQTDRRANDASAGMSKLRLRLSALKSSLFNVRTAVLGVVAAFAAWKFTSYIKESVLAAARFETLEITLDKLGEQAGYTAAELDTFEAGLRKTGIAGLETRKILTRMIQAQLDLRKATELARVAQNAAVIAGLNSSETFERMLHAIQANSVEILRTIGMNVSFAKSYKVMARELGVSVDQLTEAQRVQARFNAVLRGGIQIAGAYESAMTTAGKQMASFTRYVDDFRLEVGKSFEPALARVVATATTAMKEFTEAIKDEAFQRSIVVFADQMANNLRRGLMWLVDNKDLLIATIEEIVKAISNIATSLTFVLDKLIITEQEIVDKQKTQFERMAQTLANYIAEREKLVKDIEEQNDKLAGGGGFFEQKTLDQRTEFWKKFFDFGKTERRIEELDRLIERYRIIVQDLQKDVKEGTEKLEPEPAARKAVPESAQLQFATFLKPADTPKEPLQATLLASAFRKATADIKTELESLEITYRKSLISVDEYFKEKTALAKRNYEEERKFTQSQLEKEIDPDKKVKLQDKLYVLEKQHQSKLEQIGYERYQAEKRLSDRRLQTERTLVEAKLELQERSTDVEAFNKAEVDRLRLTQKERMKILVEGKATEEQITRAKEIEASEISQLQIDQEKRTAEERLNVQRTLEDARLRLTDPQNYIQVFEDEMAALERFQEDRLRSIIDSRLEEKEKLAAIEEHHRISELEKERQLAEQKKKIHQLYVSSAQTILSGLNQTFGDIYEASGRDAKKFFHLQKAVAVAQATIATYESAVKAYNAMVNIPYVGPALAATAAGVAVASGLAKVAVIRSQSLAEGGEVKGHSPHPKADNIPANLTAGEYVHPVDVVKHYGIRTMELIRKKMIPPELLYQATVYKDSTKLVKESFEKNLERTSGLIKDYSKRIWDSTKSFATASKDKSLTSSSKSLTSVVKAVEKISVSDRTASSIADSRAVTDREQLIVEKLFDRLTTAKESSYADTSTREYRSIRTDRERLKDYHQLETKTEKSESKEYRRDREKSEQDARYDRKDQSHVESRKDVRRDSRYVQESRERIFDSVRDGRYVEIVNALRERIENNVLVAKELSEIKTTGVVKEKIKKKVKKKVYYSDQSQTYKSKYHKIDSEKSMVDTRESFLDKMVAEKMTRDRIFQVIRESMSSKYGNESNTVLDKISEKTFKDIVSMDSVLTEKFVNKQSKAVVDKLHDSSSVVNKQSKAVVDTFVNKQSKAVVDKLIIDRLRDSSSDVDKSSISKMVAERVTHDSVVKVVRDAIKINDISKSDFVKAEERKEKIARLVYSHESLSDTNRTKLTSIFEHLSTEKVDKVLERFSHLSKTANSSMLSNLVERSSRDGYNILERFSHLSKSKVDSVFSEIENSSDKNVVIANTLDRLAKESTDRLTEVTKTKKKDFKETSTAVDKLINSAIKDTIVNERIATDSEITTNVVDRVISRIAKDRQLVDNRVVDRLIASSRVDNIIDRSAMAETFSGVKTKVDTTFIDRAITDVVKERLAERAKSITIDTRKIITSDNYLLKDSESISFTQSLLKAYPRITEFKESREALKEVLAKPIVTTVNNVVNLQNAVPVYASGATENITKYKKNISTYNFEKLTRNAGNLIKIVKDKATSTIQHFASGGPIQGYSPTSVADNITIKATAGEYIQPVNVVKHYGMQAMEAIRQRIVPREVLSSYVGNIKIPKTNYTHSFAMGGEVPKTRETSGSAQDVAQQRMLNITNLVDPALFQQYMASATGQQQFLNVITANKYEIKGILSS